MPAADVAAGAAAAVPGIQDAPYGGLSALCVPKYATDLLLPPPMPNVEGTRHHRVSTHSAALAAAWHSAGGR